MYSILYVDDEDILLNLGKIFLERTGDFTVETMNSALHATEHIKSSHYDAIVSDYEMPGKNGIELLKEVRSQCGDIPFILFTGKGREDVVIDAINNGVDFYLQKGGTPTPQFAELSHLIKKAIERKRASETLLNNEERLRFALEGTNDGLWDLDILSNKFFLSPRGWEILEYGSDNKSDPNTQWQDLVVQEDIPVISNAIDECLKRKTDLLNLEVKTRTKTGGWKWILARGKVVEWDSYGNPLRMTGTLTDIQNQKVAEENLLKSKKDWEIIFRAIGNPAFILDKNNNILEANEALYALTGKSPEEIRKLKCWQVFHNPESIHPVAGCPLEKMKQSGVMETQVMELSTVNGIFLISCTPVNDEEGSLEKVIHIATDITKSKEMEIQITETRDYLNQIFSSVKEGIVIIDAATHRILDLNNAAIEMIGAPREEILSNVCHKYICPAEQGACPISDLHQTVNNSERILLNTDGKSIPIIKYVVPFNYKGKKCLLETFYDDSVRKKAKMELQSTYEQLAAADDELKTQFEELRTLLYRIQQSEERFKGLSHLLPVPVFESDLQGGLSFTNQIGMQTFGYSDDDMKAGISVFDIISFEDKEIAEDYFFRIIQGDQSQEGIEYLLKRKSGDKFPAMVYANKIVDVNTGICTGVRGVIIDITERKRVENALRMSKEKLTLLSDITRHDILNQLHIFGIFSDLLRNMLQQYPSYIQHLDVIQNCCENIRQHIIFTQDYQQLGNDTPVWQNIEKISRVAALDNLPESISLTIHTGNYEIFADPMLMLVFFNIFDNAKRYGGTISDISISFKEDHKKGLLIIEDNGVGIPSDGKEKIFEKGFGKNTGFGLFLVRQILSITDLTIIEDGIEGHGTRFEITVPSGMWREGHPEKSKSRINLLHK